MTKGSFYERLAMPSPGTTRPRPPGPTDRGNNYFYGARDVTPPRGALAFQRLALVELVVVPQDDQRHTNAARWA